MEDKNIFIENKTNSNAESHSSLVDIDMKTYVALQQKVKNVFHEWILLSTSHGLPSIFRTEKVYLKLIWAIAFIISFGLFTLTFYNYLYTYFQHPVTVSTTLVTESPTNFPAITICNLNPFNKNRSIGFINKVLKRNNLSSLLNSTYLNSSGTPLKLYDTTMAKIKIALAGERSLTPPARQELGFYIDEMLLSCSYASSDCSVNDFQYFESYDYGNCYTYNSGESSTGKSSTIQTISSAGSVNGLEIELFAGDPNDEIFMYNGGFYIVVHNQSTTPIMENEGIHVSTGMETNIGIDRLFYYKQPYPYNQCIQNTTSLSSSSSELYQAILKKLNQNSYRQKYCFKLCYQEVIINTCACYDPEYPTPFSVFKNVTLATCLSSTELTCMMSAKASFQKKGVDADCLNQCPQECNSLTYQTSISTAAYPRTDYLNLLMLNSNFTNKFSNQSELARKIKESIAKINIFYNDIHYTALIEQPVLTWDVLLSNIGGQMGLFIGISALSLIEIIEILFEICRTIYIHKREAKINIKS